MIVNWEIIMKKIVEQNYKDMVKILDFVYFQTYNDDLGSLMGNLAMDIFADGLPADWADYEFWLACIEPIKKTDLKNQTIAFLKAFSAEYPSYDMSATILCVESLTIEQINQIVES